VKKFLEAKKKNHSQSCTEFTQSRTEKRLFKKKKTFVALGAFLVFSVKKFLKVKK